MKNKFSHIFRLLTISFLMIGFLAHLMVPFSSQAQKTAFTQWLNHNVVTSGNETELKLRNSIRELPEQSGNFWALVQQASELVANHKEDFKISFSFSDFGDQPQRVTSWLIGQWNVYHHHKTATNAILPELVQPVHKWIASIGFSSADLPKLLKKDLFDSRYTTTLFQFVPRAVSLIPLASGISINAP